MAQRERFGMLPLSVMSRDLIPAAKLVYAALAMHANSDGLAWPSVETLARCTRLSKRHVQEQLVALANAGVIVTELRPGKVTRYQLTHAPECTGEPERTGEPECTPAPERANPCTRVREPMHSSADDQNKKKTRDQTNSPAPSARDRSPRSSRKADQPGEGTDLQGELLPCQPEASPTSKRKKAAKETDPRVKPVLDAFARAHLDALGVEYPGSFGRDGKLIKQLPPGYTAEKIIAAIPKFFGDRWEREHGPSIPKFVGKLASLVAGASGGGSDPQSPEAHGYRSAEEVFGKRRGAA